MTIAEWNTIYAASTNEDAIITAIKALSDAKMNGTANKIAWLDYLNCNSASPWECTGFQSDW